MSSFDNYFQPSLCVLLISTSTLLESNGFMVDIVDSRSRELAATLDATDPRTCFFAAFSYTLILSGKYCTNNFGVNINPRVDKLLKPIMHMIANTKEELLCSWLSCTTTAPPIINSWL